MNLAKSKVVLKKINNLYDTLELSEQISKIEKDLLLDYVKELYESVILIENKEAPQKEVSISPTPTYKEKEEAAPEINIPEEVKEEPVIKEESVEFKEELEEAMSAIDPIPAPRTNGVHQVKEPIAPVAPVPTYKKVSGDIEALFDPSIINQVDYRFGQTPITDVTKAMGINERMLVVNLLFNKEQQEFNYITSKLNYFDSFEEAANYLKTEVASKFDWSAVDKKDKAIEFIKLVKRKYA